MNSQASAPGATAAEPATDVKFGFLFRRLVQINSALFTEEVAHLSADMTPTQFSILTTLSKKGQLDQNSLALEVALERSSVAEILPRLESRGIVERRQSLDDKRVKLVRLTRKGSEVVKRLMPAVQRAHDRTVGSLSSDESALLASLLLRVIEADDHRSQGSVKLR